ncbi:hemolysin activation/secretion protein [Methylophilaceae bacterium 11]|uniref:ShlB/FhaC/HecB family hemolysin secretion/activation protein n=1 Tax=Methylotenera sp. N17 TaxID=1502761 RepID=UPI00044732B9|nr:ShlB/FhaC/HecB family hemolysin secretion/activation protein [Methylotenera sp. N17]EUJ10439.1 hemolysin activation/secretion protein [Methylophilaceae bacterium 11]
MQTPLLRKPIAKHRWTYILLLLAPLRVLAEHAEAPPAPSTEQDGPAPFSQSNGSPAPDKTTQAPEKETPKFNVFEFKVDGNTVLGASKIEEAVYPFMGEAKTIDDVEKARSALEKTYQDAGYLTVSVSIPQQEVDTGVVRLLVTEGTVEALRIKDAQYTSLAEIKSRVAEFQEGKVPHFPTAQQQLGTVNKGQNRQVTPVLRPGKSPGKVDVDLKVQDKLPLHGSLELNDRYSSNTTETRLNGSMRYENLWQKDHSIGLSFQVSPEDLNEVKVFSGTYVIPRLNGDYFAAYGVISDSDISAVGDVSVIGKGYIAGARYIHPLPYSENFYQGLTLGADYKTFKESVVLLGADGFNTPISYLAFMVGYDGTYQTSSSQTQLNLAFNFAPRGLGNNEREFNDKRDDAKPNYAFLRADLKHTHKLPMDWSVQAKLGGQIASDKLISAEQFTIGGVDSVRGYLESSELGDNGVLASLELRTPPLKKYISQHLFSDYIKDFYAFGFVDAGITKTYLLSGSDSTRELTSAGLGFKIKSNGGVFTNLDYAHAYKDAVQVDKGDDRLHFRVGYEW